VVDVDLVKLARGVIMALASHKEVHSTTGADSRTMATPAPPATDVQTSPWISIPEAARLAGVSRCTVWRVVQRGEVGAIRVGNERGPIRIDREAFLRWLLSPERGRRDPRHPPPPRSPIRVRLESPARQAISREIFIRLEEIQRGFETGGAPFARVRTDRYVIVSSADGPGIGTRRERYSMTVDLAELASEEYFRNGMTRASSRSFIGNGCERLVGHWHVHPCDEYGAPDPGIPSDEDIETWRSHLCDDVPWWIGLIAVRGYGQRWTRPRLFGYLVEAGNTCDAVLVQQ
jgi:excisionase family DNA binding protein